MARRSRLKDVETQYGKPLKQLLPELIEKHGTLTAVAIALGVTQGALSMWLKINQLKVKHVIVPETEPEPA